MKSIILVAVFFVVAVNANVGPNYENHLQASSGVSYNAHSSLNHKISGVKPIARNFLQRRLSQTAVAPEPVKEFVPEEPTPEEPKPELEPIPAPTTDSDYISEESNEEIEKNEQEHLKEGNKNNNLHKQNDKKIKKKNTHKFEAYNKADEDVQKSADKLSKKKTSVNWVKDVTKSKYDLSQLNRLRQHNHSSFKDHTKNTSNRHNQAWRKNGLGGIEEMSSSLVGDSEESLHEKSL